jgi:hypothetical protein
LRNTAPVPVRFCDVVALPTKTRLHSCASVVKYAKLLIPVGSEYLRPRPDAGVALPGWAQIRLQLSSDRV